ncbi:MAG: hypothetical protein JJT99_06760 [Rhodobacteraceae bacterium]|nr:hypothetical protein [Paracoccaceae bacterium]
MIIADLFSTQRPTSEPAATGGTLAASPGFAALMAASDDAHTPEHEGQLAAEDMIDDMPVLAASDDMLSDIAPDKGQERSARATAGDTQARMDPPADAEAGDSPAPDLPKAALASAGSGTVPDPAAVKLRAADLPTHPLAATLAGANASGRALAFAPVPAATQRYLLPDPASPRLAPVQLGQTSITLGGIAPKLGAAWQSAPAPQPLPLQEAELPQLQAWVTPEDAIDDRASAPTPVSGPAVWAPEPGQMTPSRAITPPPTSDDTRLSLLRHALQMAADQPDGSIEIELGDDQQGRIRITLLRHDGGVQLALLSGRAELQEMMRKSLSLLRDDLVQLGCDDIHLTVRDADTRQTLASLGQREPRTGTVSGSTAGGQAMQSLPLVMPVSMDLRI